MKIESPVLRRLGPVPFWRGTKKCLPELDAVYRRARESAESALASGEARHPIASPDGFWYTTRQFARGGRVEANERGLPSLPKRIESTIQK